MGVIVASAVFSTGLIVLSVVVALTCYCKNKVQAELDLHIYDLPEGPPLPPRKGEQAPSGTVPPHTMETTFHSMNQRGDNTGSLVSPDDGACSQYEHCDALNGGHCKAIPPTHQAELINHKEEATSCYIPTQDNIAYRLKLMEHGLVSTVTNSCVFSSHASSSHNIYEQICGYERVQHCDIKIAQLNRLPLTNHKVTDSHATACKEQELLASNKELATCPASYEHCEHGDLTTDHSNENAQDMETKTSTTMSRTQSLDQVSSYSYEQIQRYERICHCDLPILHMHMPQSASPTIVCTDQNLKGEETHSSTES